MRRSEDFRRTVRRGVRAGRRTVVVHAFRLDGERPDGPADSPTVPETGTVGFVVSRAVGSAVVRNRVKRRLRHLARARLAELDGASGAGVSGAGVSGAGASGAGGSVSDSPTLVVVRALPAAAQAGPELGSDLDAAWTSALSRLAQR
jgi:ribonuclease P protein component